MAAWVPSAVHKQSQKQSLQITCRVFYSLNLTKPYLWIAAIIKWNATLQHLQHRKMSVWPDLTEITGGKTNPQRTMTLTKFSKIMKIFNFDEFFFFPDLAEMGIKFETDCLRTTDSDHMWMLLGLNHFWRLNVQLVIWIKSVSKNFVTFFEGGGGG